jgi:hypothetical protein
LIKLALIPNVTVFALLDCCRTVQAIKGSYESPPMRGQCYIGFGTKSEKLAIAPAGSNSAFTDFFIKFVNKKGRLDLPGDILMWEWLNWGEYLCTCQRNFRLATNDTNDTNESSRSCTYQKPESSLIKALI